MFKLSYPGFWQSKNSFISILLIPIAGLYYLIARLKEILSKPVRLPIPVISVGNINIGGTGKTQMTLYLARLLTKHGKRVCIATKGYGRNSSDTRLIDIKLDDIKQTGDEAFMLAKYFPVIIYQDTLQLVKIIESNRFEIAIFDDAMQNHKIIKDFSVVMIDGLRGFGNHRLLPAGPLRERVCAINTKADCAILIGQDLLNIKQHIKIPLFNAKIIPKKEFILTSTESYIAFAGIGNPEKFYLTLKEYGVRIISKHDFPDHYIYSIEDLEELNNIALKLGANLITTEKDWVKLPKIWQQKIKYLEVSLEIHEESTLEGMLNETILKKSKILN
ncbi:MAG: lpxK [Rickettsiaceae bacterium]|jgi:tetraacyldisaccharide 4'-kinase|nr:lpxK [Rickettsiaceae bacterium]